jgi:hypothetical protein
VASVATLMLLGAANAVSDIAASIARVAVKVRRIFIWDLLLLIRHKIEWFDRSFIMKSYLCCQYKNTILKAHNIINHPYSFSLPYGCVIVYES